MTARTMTICFVFVLGATVRGGMVLELVPHRPGPYEPAASVDVDVLLINHEGRTVQPRLITLDFSVTDPNLIVPSAFHFQLVPPLVSDALYARFETMPKVDIVYTSTSPASGFLIDISDGAAFTLGTINVVLPIDPGTYVLDAMNADSPDSNSGARVDEGFERRYTFSPIFDSLTGGTLEMTVVPEPATVVLLTLGGVGLLAGRRQVR